MANYLRNVLSSGATPFRQMAGYSERRFPASQSAIPLYSGSPLDGGPDDQRQPGGAAIDEPLDELMTGELGADSAASSRLEQTPVDVVGYKRSGSAYPGSYPSEVAGERVISRRSGLEAAHHSASGSDLGTEADSAARSSSAFETNESRANPLRADEQTDVGGLISTSDRTGSLELEVPAHGDVVDPNMLGETTPLSEYASADYVSNDEASTQHRSSRIAEARSANESSIHERRGRVGELVTADSHIEPGIPAGRNPVEPSQTASRWNRSEERPTEELTASLPAPDQRESITRSAPVDLDATPGEMSGARSLQSTMRSPGRKENLSAPQRRSTESSVAGSADGKLAVEGGGDPDEPESHTQHHGLVDLSRTTAYEPSRHQTPVFPRTVQASTEIYLRADKEPNYQLADADQHLSARSNETSIRARTRPRDYVQPKSIEPPLALANPSVQTAPSEAPIDDVAKFVRSTAVEVVDSAEAATARRARPEAAGAVTRSARFSMLDDTGTETEQLSGSRAARSMPGFKASISSARAADREDNQATPRQPLLGSLRERIEDKEGPGGRFPGRSPEKTPTLTIGRLDIQVINQAPERPLEGPGRGQMEKRKVGLDSIERQMLGRFDLA